MQRERNNNDRQKEPIYSIAETKVIEELGFKVDTQMSPHYPVYAKVIPTSFNRHTYKLFLTPYEIFGVKFGVANDYEYDFEELVEDIAFRSPDSAKDLRSLMNELETSKAITSHKGNQ